jgi:hypothetical protein
MNNQGTASRAPAAADGGREVGAAAQSLLGRQHDEPVG